MAKASNRIRGITRLALILIFGVTTCYADLELVDSEDRLFVFKGQLSDNLEDAEFNQTISGFKGYNYFTQNQTNAGRVGYISEEGYRDDLIMSRCIDAVDIGGNSWILMLPFKSDKFSYILENLPVRFPSIKSIIFSYNGAPDIGSDAPPNNILDIISFANMEQLENITGIAVPNSQEYFFRHNHTFTEYGDVMDPSFKFYLITISIWGFITVAHVLWTWILKKDYSKHIQKILLFIPVFFAAYTLMDYIYFLGCPWITNSGIQYLQIVQIAIVTIFNTLFVGLCCFISKGWSIVRNNFSREELSSITMIVGIFYLVYSAYFIASDIPNLRIAIIIILIIMYLWVALVCLKNGIVNIRTLQSHIEMTGREEVILESLKLKKYLMINFGIITTVFYTNKIIMSSLRTFIYDNITIRNIIISNLFIELAIITYFLIIFRARKWPEYFGLDVFYQRVDSNNPEEAPPKSMILHAMASSQWLEDHYAKDCMINNEEESHPGKARYKEPQVAVGVDTSDLDNCRSFRILKNEEIPSEE